MKGKNEAAFGWSSAGAFAREKASAASTDSMIAEKL